MKTPQDNYAEQMVLSTVLRQPEAMEKVAEKLSHNDFYSAEHRKIAKGMSELFAQSKTIDIVTLSESLERTKTQVAIAYLDELIKLAASSSSIDNHIQRVLDCAIRRRLIAVASSIEKAARDSTGNIETLLDESEVQLSRLKHQETTDRLQDTHQILKQTIARIEEVSSIPNSDGVVGLRTGYKDFDTVTSGLRGGQLIILAARPSMGKTTLAMNMVEFIALNNRRPALVFSLEMPSEKLIMRMLASISRVELVKIQNGQLTLTERERVESSATIIHQRAQLYIDDSSDLTPTEIRSRARRVSKKHGGLSHIMIDYLQLMRVPSKSDNRTQEIAEISRSLKALAKE